MFQLKDNLMNAQTSLTSCLCTKSIVYYALNNLYTARLLKMTRGACMALLAKSS